MGEADSGWTLRTLKEHLETLVAQRFDAQDKAVSSALSAQKELTSAAFASSEKAITKAEEAQKAYNQTHNDLSRKMDEQYKEMMPRSESLARHASNELRHQELKDDFSKVQGQVKDDFSKLRIELMKEISDLRESRSKGEGKGTGAKNTVVYVVLAVGLLVSLITIGSAVVAIAFAIRQ